MKQDTICLLLGATLFLNWQMYSRMVADKLRVGFSSPNMDFSNHFRCLEYLDGTGKYISKTFRIPLIFWSKNWWPNEKLHSGWNCRNTCIQITVSLLWCLVPASGSMEIDKRQSLIYSQSEKPLATHFHYILFSSLLLFLEIPFPQTDGSLLPWSSLFLENILWL